MRIYERNSDDWEQVGADIDGEAAGDGPATASLFLLTAAPSPSVLSTTAAMARSGHVRIYQHNGASNVWDKSVKTSMESPLVIPPATASRFLLTAPSPLVLPTATAMAMHPAMCVSMSAIQTAIGNKLVLTSMEELLPSTQERLLTDEHVAIGATGTNGEASGRVSIYQHNGASNVWEQVGAASMEKPLLITPEIASLCQLTAASPLALLETTAMEPVLAMCASISAM